MAVVRTSLPLGEFKSNGKPVKITRKRAQGWCDKFAALKSQGVEFGVPWGHFEQCGPGGKEFLSSKFNAGYLKDLQVGPDGKLDIVMDCPGLSKDDQGRLVADSELPDGTKVKTAIKEVSPGIWPSWTDGQGNTHSDILGHVALCVMPVVAGQAGFDQEITKLSTVLNTDKVIYLSTEKPDLKEEIEEVSDPEPEEDLETILTPQEQSTGVDEQMTRIMAMMAEGGLQLPPDTNKENFFDRWETALGVVLPMLKAKAAAAAQEAPTEPPLVEENSPTTTMLSTIIRDIQANPTVKNLFERELKSRKESRATRIDALKRKGLKVSIADRLGAKPIFLSTIIDSKGQLKDDQSDEVLAMMEEQFADSQFDVTFLSLTTPPNADAHDSPAADSEMVQVGTIKMTKKQAKELDDAKRRVT